jgi:DNA-binding CsgD family transcriptional regulator
MTRGLTQTDLLERQDELARLEQGLADALRGEGTLLVVEGAPGIGKTRLLHEARAAASGCGLDVVTARGAALEHDFPYGVVRQLFERPLAAAGEGERERLLAGAAALAAPALESLDTGVPDFGLSVAHGLYWLTANLAERRPLLLGVDDAHWADDASLRFLAYLARRLDDLPVCVLVTTRPPEPDVLALAELIRDAHAHALQPRELSPEAVAAMLARAFGQEPEPPFAAACAEATGGNPFLLRELIRALEADGAEPVAAATGAVRSLGPRTVSRSLLLRIAHLPGGAAVARAVAVLAGDAEPRHVAALAGLDGGEAGAVADALCGAGVLAPGRPLEFVHPILREAIYADIPETEREALHAAAARTLAAAGRPVQAVALHLGLAPPDGDQRAVATLRAAAAHAFARGMPQVSVAHLQRALAESPPADERAAIMSELSAAQLRSGRLGEAERHARESLDGAGGAVAAERRREVARAVLATGDLAGYVAEMELAAAEAGDDDLAFAIEAEMAGTGWRLPEVSGRIGAMLEQHAGASGRTPAELAVLAVLSRYRVSAAHSAQDAVRMACSALADGRLLASLPAESPPYLTAVYVLIVADEFAEAERLLDLQLARARATGTVIGFTGGMVIRSILRLRAGALKDAEADARIAMNAMRAAMLLHVAAPPSMAVIVEALTLQGLLDDAEEALRANGMETLPATAQYARLLFSRGLLRLAQGRPAEALDDLLTAGPLEEPAGMLNPGAPWREHAAHALSLLGRGEEAAAMSEEWLALAAAWGGASVHAGALRAAARFGDPAARLERLEAAAALLAPTGVRLEHAVTLCELGAELRRAGRRGAAAEALRRADDLAQACGAEPLVARVRAELGIAGARPLARRFSGADALTASERRVAELAAAGRSNKEIAQSLFITAKTVENHLGRVYGKLGIGSRKAIAQALGDG